MSNIPQHRRAGQARSGDAIVIGADGSETNLDQQRRDEAAAAASKAAPKTARAKPAKADSETINQG